MKTNFVNSKYLNDKNYKEKKKYNHGNKAFEEMLIDFQNFLKDKKLIEGDDSFKKIARQFIKCRKVMYKKNAKHKPTVVNSSNECDHDYRSGFSLAEGSFVWCAKCKQRWSSKCK